MNRFLISFWLIVVQFYFVTNSNGQEAKVNLFVFVGEKISVEAFSPVVPEGSYLMDNAYKAKYKIIKTVYGQFENDTIEFEVYDHYGFPPFAAYTNVLLYVSKAGDGTWFHQKYQYSDVYLTTDGRWASSYDRQGYGHVYNDHTSIAPESISFKDSVSYEIGELQSEWFPAPYYEIKNGRAYVVMGNYVEELFLLRKNGVLKARGIF
jgi:hypothetical protein